MRGVPNEHDAEYVVKLTDGKVNVCHKHFHSLARKCYDPRVLECALLETPAKCEYARKTRP